MASLGDVFLRLRSDDRQYQQEVVKQGGKAGDKAGKAAGQNMARQIGSSLKKHSTLIATTAGAALGTFVAGAGQDFAKFETSMNEVFTLLPDISETAMAEMEEQVKQFSNEFGKMPDEVVPALYQSLSAGVPQDNVFEFLETANKLAVGGVAQTGEAVSVLAAITKGYGDTSEEATKAVSDMLFTTVKLGTTTIPELAASLGKAVPQAAALNVAQEELFATTAALTGVTGNTAEVSTQMKAVFTSLLNPTAQMKEGLTALGFESGEAAIESLGLQGTLQALGETTDGDTAKFAKMLGSSEALTAGLAITGARADAVQDNLAEMGAATGATDKAFERMDTGVQAAANRIAARIKTLSIGIGEHIAPIGPLLTAFGPTFGRALGGAFGAAFSFVGIKIPGLIAKHIAKPMVASMMASSFAANIGNALTSVMGKAATGAGKVAGSRFGIAFKVAAIAGIALLWLEVWRQFTEFQNKVAESQANLQKQADAAVEQTGSEAIRNLEGFSKTLGDMNIGQRLLADTAGGKQISDSLRNLSKAIENEAELSAEEIEQAGVVMAQAAKDAYARGNKEVGDEIVAMAEVVAAKTPVVKKAIAEGVEEAVEEGTEEGLEELGDDIDAQVEAALKEAGLDLPETIEDELADPVKVGLNDAIREGLDAVAGGDRGLVTAFSGLGEEAAVALRDAIRGKTPIEEAFANLDQSTRDALAPLVPVVKEQLREARRTARHEAALMGTSIREGIRESKDVVKTAMADLKFAMTNPLKAVKAIAKVEGALTGKQLRNGLQSGDPLIRAEALRVRATLVEQWEEMTGEAWDHGKSTSENLGKGIKARRKAARRAARKNKEAVNAEHAQAAADAEGYGEDTTESYAEGVEDPDAVQEVRDAAKTAVRPVKSHMRIRSPAEEGPLSEGGGPEGWGGRFAELYGKGMGDMGMSIGDSLGLNALNPLRNLARSSAPGVDGGGGGQTVNLETYGLPMRAQTPLEVVHELRRGARVGLTPKRRTPEFSKG